MKPRVYVETSVISYLSARRSRDIIVAAHQEVTADWWQFRRPLFDLFVSQSVLAEAAAGDPDAAGRRLEVLADLAVLEITQDAQELASTLLSSAVVPPRATEDALHIAIATVHGMDYLLTWNCRHIANVEIRKKLATALADLGFEPPGICTPEELSGE